MNIRFFNEDDTPAVVALWNESAETECVLRRIRDEDFERKYLNAPGFEKRFAFVAEEGEKVVGFICGDRKHEFLPGETEENTPGYLSVIFVAQKNRGHGVGTALLQALEGALQEAGKRFMRLDNNDPINKDWVIPGTTAQHNNAPGVDEECPAFKFLLSRGYTHLCSEIAMYLDLSKYVPPKDFFEKRERLAAEGVTTGRYDTKLHYEFDGMCDRVHSEYWRKVLEDETAKENPRPIIAATVPGHIVGFTGPVDLEKNGRGWFTGICTDPLYEKRGIATVLFNLLMQEFVQEGAKYSTLFTGSDNHAQRVYLRAGFAIVRRFAQLEKKF